MTKTLPNAPPRPPDAPRPLPSLRRFVSVRTWFLLLFGGPFFLNGLIIATVFTLVGGPPWVDWSLDRSAAQAEATPTGVQSTSSRQNRRRVMRITYRFRDAGGIEHDGQQSTIDPALIGRARAGTPITVEYDPQNPTHTRVAGERASFFGPFIFLPLAFALIGLVPFALGVRGVMRDRRIYREGEAALATVGGVRQSSVRFNRRRAWAVEYEYLTATAGTVRGKRLLVEAPVEGARIWVIYDPTRPQDHVVAVA